MEIDYDYLRTGTAIGVSRYPTRGRLQASSRPRCCVMMPEGAAAELAHARDASPSRDALSSKLFIAIPRYNVPLRCLSIFVINYLQLNHKVIVKKI